MALTYHRKKEEKDTNAADPWQLLGAGSHPIQQTQEPAVAALASQFSDEQLAQFLDGNASPALQMRILDAARHDAALAALLREAAQIDLDVRENQQHRAPRRLPLEALAAAEGTDGTLCGIHCEEHVLRRRGIAFDEQELIQVAKEHGWLQEGGTRIADLGNILQTVGLSVEKNFDSDLKDLADYLEQGKDVIAVVDGGELVGNRDAERLEDHFIGQIPDHAVVVTKIDPQRSTVELYRPQSNEPPRHLSHGAILRRLGRLLPLPRHHQLDPHAP